MLERSSEKFIDHLLITLVSITTTIDRFYKHYGISRVHFLALLHIMESGEDRITLSQLGEKMAVSRANITTLIDRMEKAELVQRAVDPEDRRSIKVLMLPKGRKIFEEIIPRRKAFAESVLKNMTEEDIALGEDMLMKVRMGLKEQMENIK